MEKLEGTPSSPPSDPYFQSVLGINNNGHGLRILSVTPHSTGQLLGFEAYFDFIVRVNGHELPMIHSSKGNSAYSIGDDGSIRYGEGTDDMSMVDYNALGEEFSRSAASGNGTIILEVWSSKGGILREIPVPLDTFAADVDVDVAGVLKLYKNIFKPLGLVVQSSHLKTATFVWRVINTHKGSPAFQAQMVPYSDYVIGCDSSFPSDENGKGLLVKGGEDLFSKTILAYYNHHLSILREDSIPITLYVYNHDYDVLRPVTVNLSKSWCTGQNRGILGCEVGYGLLHRIPEVAGKFDVAAGLVIDSLNENKKKTDHHLEPKIDVTPNASFLNSSKSTAEHSSTSAIADLATKFTPPPAMGSSVLSTASHDTRDSTIDQLVAPPPAKSMKKKQRHHAPVSLNGLADFMNDELSKSKAKDILNPVEANLQAAATAPPPPIKHK